MAAFFMPSMNLMGAGCLSEAADAIQARDFRKALIVTDNVLNALGMVKKVTSLLDERNVNTVVFDGTKPNPTIANVEDGLAMLKENQCDCVISIGGGSSHDCAKAIALVATNGGQVQDYLGVDASAKPQLPMFAINTTAGTAAEMTRAAVITDEARHTKVAIVDKHITPLMSVNDPELMVGQPASLTAATGMDALTHAIEAYVSVAAYPITDACAIKAIELIHGSLREAVANGGNIEARDAMAQAQFLAGMAFNNAYLGYVHAMAHQVGGRYDLPHGVCNAIILPHVQAFNAEACPERLRDIAKAMGVDIAQMSPAEGARAAVEAIKTLSEDIGIPTGLAAIGAKAEDIPELATQAMEDMCGLTNPRAANYEDVCTLFEAAM